MILILSRLPGYGQNPPALPPKSQESQKAEYIGEIIGHSYIKVTLEIPNSPNEQYVHIPVKGALYEAISGRTYRVIGTYNQDTFIWKLRSFYKNHKEYCRFEGKQKDDEGIEGKWNYRKSTRNFYLKKAH